MDPLIFFLILSTTCTKQATIEKMNWIQNITESNLLSLILKPFKYQLNTCLFDGYLGMIIYDFCNILSVIATLD